MKLSHSDRAQSETFDDIVASMAALLKELRDSPPYVAPKYSGLPKKGIYVFYEDGKPIYVGRVGKASKQTIRSRIGQHTRPSSGHNQATFAFRLLQEDLDVVTGHGAPLTRQALAEKHADKFREMKQRVRNMMVRAVEIEDSPTQAVFEVYAALVLGTTRHNNFDTH